MGGTGSGRRCNSRTETCEYQQFDIREWRRNGLLVPGRSFYSGWWRIEIDVPREDRAKPVRVALNHIGNHATILVWLPWTNCAYGGMRPWFLCPNCYHRVGVLYAESRSIGCRRCFRLAYPTENTSRHKRELFRAQAIRMKLGGSVSLVDPFPARPKGMHLRTYLRLSAKADMAEAIVFGELSRFLRREFKSEG